MTNKEYLNSLLWEKEQRFNNIALLSKTGNKEIVRRAIEEYNILDAYCLRLQNFIEGGILDADAEKKP